jgi:hypothetical protein
MRRGRPPHSNSHSGWLRRAAAQCRGGTPLLLCGCGLLLLGLVRLVLLHDDLRQLHQQMQGGSHNASSATHPSREVCRERARSGMADARLQQRCLRMAHHSC